MAANPPAPAVLPVTVREFPGTAGQVRQARRFLAALLDGCPAADDALICVSELVTNAVLHSLSGSDGGQFGVQAVTRPGRLRVEVTDEGGPWEPAGHGSGQHGRGLLIVEKLAARWGRDGSDYGRTVWFEIDCPCPAH
jgi:anti-sigma regulatory factor (Ser/Thr protein kinase)